MKIWVVRITIIGLFLIPTVTDAQSEQPIPAAQPAQQSWVQGKESERAVVNEKSRGPADINTTNRLANPEEQKTLFPDRSKLGASPYQIPSPTPLSPLPTPAPTPAPTPQTPSTVRPEKGVIDPRSGDFYPGVFGGAINPKTGDFLPKTGGGFINPRTGEFFPAK